MRLTGVNLPLWSELPDFGLYMDQVMTCVERVFAGFPMEALTPGMVNSYVKSGLVDRPAGKKYSRAALSQLLMVCLLKQTSSLDILRRLLHPEGLSAEEVYSAFRADLGAVSSALSAGSTPLEAALRAAAWQQLCRELLEA